MLLNLVLAGAVHGAPIREPYLYQRITLGADASVLFHEPRRVVGGRSRSIDVGSAAQFCKDMGFARALGLEERASGWLFYPAAHLRGDGTPELGASAATLKLVRCK